MFIGVEIQLHYVQNVKTHRMARSCCDGQNINHFKRAQSVILGKIMHVETQNGRIQQQRVVFEYVCDSLRLNMCHWMTYAVSYHENSSIDAWVDRTCTCRARVEKVPPLLSTLSRAE